MNTASRFILAFFLPLVLAACATAPPQFTDPRPLPSAEQRAGFGVIGIAVGKRSGTATPPVPGSMSGTEKTAMTVGAGAVGAGYGAIAGLGCGPIAPACVPVFAGAFGAGGLLAGAVTSVIVPSPEMVNSADITLRNALSSASVERRLVEFVTAQAARTTGRELWPVDPVPGAEPWQTSDGRVVDTLLVLDVPALTLFQLNPRQQRNPDVRLEMVVEGRILRKGREAPVFERRWRHDSEAHGYFDWAEDQGALVLAEVDKAISAAGGQITADFLARQMNAASTDAPTVGVSGPGGIPTASQEGGASADGREEDENAKGDFFTKAGDFLGDIFSWKPMELE